MALYELEVCHGVNLGFAYKRVLSANLFTCHFADSLHQQLLEDLSRSKFYIFLMEGSKNIGNVEQQLTIHLSCKEDDLAGENTTYARFFCAVSPNKAAACGLVKCLSQSLPCLSRLCP